MEIITGYTGTPHIKSENDRDINIGLCGAGSYVMGTGMKMAAEVSTNNEVKIRDGVIMHQGCAAAIKKNTYDSLTINNGSQGMKRIDLIIARYQRNPETGVEEMVLKVVQGTPSEAAPSAPDYVIGDIQAGDTISDMPMYRVHIEGLNIVEVEPLYKVLYNAAEIQDMVTELNRKSNGELTFDSTVKNASSTDTSFVYKRGHKVCLFLDISATINGENNIFATLPVGFRPSRIIRFSGTAGSSYWNASHAVSFMVYPAGYVTGVCSSATPNTKYARGYIEFDID